MIKGQKKRYGKRTERNTVKQVDVYFSLNSSSIITEIYKKGNSKTLKNMQATDIE